MKKSMVIHKLAPNVAVSSCMCMTQGLAPPPPQRLPSHHHKPRWTHEKPVNPEPPQLKPRSLTNPNPKALNNAPRTLLFQGLGETQALSADAVPVPLQGDPVPIVVVTAMLKATMLVLTTTTPTTIVPMLVLEIMMTMLTIVMTVMFVLMMLMLMLLMKTMMMMVMMITTAITKLCSSSEPSSSSPSS